MAAASGITTFIGFIFFGVILVVFMGAWDYLVYGMNVLTIAGYQSQDALNAFNMLTIMINSFGFFYVLALVLNMIVSARNARSGIQ
jgi:hypothetical protein